MKEFNRRKYFQIFDLLIELASNTGVCVDGMIVGPLIADGRANNVTGLFDVRWAFLLFR